MIILKEAQKIDIMDYLEKLDSFISSFVKILSKIYKQPTILEATKPADELDRAFRIYKKRTEDAFAVLEKEILAKIKALDDKLEKGGIEGNGINVPFANAYFDGMNKYIDVIQSYKDQLPVFLSTITKSFNKLIDDFNKTIEDYPKVQKGKSVKKLKKLK